METQTKKCGTCDDTSCAAKQKGQNETPEEFANRQKLAKNLCGIKHKILVMSGKGGVGKSTTAVNVAMDLSLRGFKTGLMDIDIHGPSVPTLLGLENSVYQTENEDFIPITVGDNLKVMSIGFFLNNQDDALIWRGPMKMGIIQQFLKDVLWGELDYLVVDLPPGTGDEPLSVCQLIGEPDGAVIVTTPQNVSIVDVRKCVTFCHKLNVPIVGVVENMSGFVCPKCGETVEIFKSGGGESMAKDMEIPFIAKIPMDPEIMELSDAGRPVVAAKEEGPILEAINSITTSITNFNQKETK